MHVYLPDLDVMADALRSVLLDIRKRDDVGDRKTYLAGESLGGFTVTSYGMSVLFPSFDPFPRTPQISKLKSRENSRYKDPAISGLLIGCPMIQIAPE
jgi:hypothetical protein